VLKSRRVAIGGVWERQLPDQRPPDWNGGLIMFAHDYQGEGSGTGTARTEPLDAFDDLVTWLENGTGPAGHDVLGDVSQLGLRWKPLPHPKDQRQ